MITITKVQRYYRNHRTLVEVTITRNWFQRLFMNAEKKIYFIGYGAAFTKIDL